MSKWDYAYLESRLPLVRTVSLEQTIVNRPKQRTTVGVHTARSDYLCGSYEASGSYRVTDSPVLVRDKSGPIETLEKFIPFIHASNKCGSFWDLPSAAENQSLKGAVS